MPVGPSSRTPSSKPAATPSHATKPTSLSSHATSNSNHRQQQQQQQKEHEESKEQLTASSTTTASATPHQQQHTPRHRPPPTASALPAYATKTPLLVERAVVHDELVRTSLHADLARRYDSAMLGPPDTIDTLAATSLLLSFRNLAVIDHLGAFVALTRLQLDNNHLTRVQGLDALVNLTWLDLSFNQLTRIEGLERLTKLTDLALSHNHIECIGEGLGHLHGTLQCLTLAHNRLTQVDEVKRLRPFSALRLLVLRDNPMHAAQPEEYALTVLAFLTQLVYFDYVAVEDGARLKARDNKLDAVLLLEQREAEERKGADEAEARTRRSERNRALGCCDGIERLWEAMLDKDVEARKLRALPGVGERLAVYEAKVDAAVREYEEAMYGVGEGKREEEARVREAWEAVNGRAERECQAAIKQFGRDKKRLRAQYDALLANPPPHTATTALSSPAAATGGEAVVSVLLPTLTALLNGYHTLLHAHISQLMRVQSALTHGTSLLLAAFDTALHELSAQWSTRTQQAFQALLAVSKQYHDGLHDHVAVLLEATTATTTTATAAAGKDDAATAAAKADKQPAATTDGRAEATDSAVVGGGGGGGGGRGLLGDKEALLSAMSASRDCHDSLIMAKEDELREREERGVKERVAAWRLDMVEQNRARVAEIYEMKRREERVIEEMMEKLSGDDEEDDGDVAEQR